MNDNPTPEQVRRWVFNSLGDDVVWKTLYAVQNKGFETREEALVHAIKFCGGIDHKKVAELLVKN